MTELLDHDTPPVSSESAAAASNWPRRIPLLILGTAILVRIVVLMAMSRNWFFVIDDWDYLNRIGILSVFDPHFGHLTGGVAGYALVARRLVGYDYWPAYPIAVAFSWPAVSVAAYWVWRKLGVERLLAASLAVLLLWFATASWLQFGLAGAGYAVALSVLAVYVDGLPLNRRTVALGLGLGAAATFLTSIGAIAVAVRLVLGLVYRRWTAVATTVPVAIGYGALRLGWGAPPGSPESGSWGFADLFDMIRLAFEIVGAGFRTLFPLPPSLAVIVGALFILGCVLILWRARLPYFGVALFTTGIVYLGSIMYVRFLGSPFRIRAVFADGFDINAQVSTVRFPNMVLTMTLIALVPFLPALADRLRTKVTIFAAIAFMTVFTAIGSIDRWDWIADRSGPIANEVAGIVEMRRADEPVFDEEAALYPSISERFTVGAIDRMLREGWDESLLRSEVYNQFDSIEISPETRALFRFRVTRGGPFEGTWSALSAPEGKQCRPIDDGEAFVVADAATFKLKGATEASMTWLDAFGEASRTFTEEDWSRFNFGVTVRMAPPSDGDPTTLTFGGEGLRICLGVVDNP